MLNSCDCYVRETCKKWIEGTCPNSDEFCIKLFKINELFKNSLLSEKQMLYQELRLDNTRQDRDAFLLLKDIQNNIVSFVDKGGSLYLYSPMTGNGKTSWAIRLMQAYILGIWYNSPLTSRTLFINIPRYLIELKNSISSPSEYIDRISDNILTADLIVFDDIGTKVGTDYEIEHLMSAINTRIECGKSNIYTSNVFPSNLADMVGARLASRIIGGSTVIEFKEDDKRGVLK